MRFIDTVKESDARLTRLGLGLLALLAATGVALLVDPRQIGGAPAWMKPAKFAASITIYTLTLAWVFTYLREWPRTRRAVSGITSAVLLAEIAIIYLQAWRGTTSHFNVATTFDAVLFSIMGAAIFVQTVASIWVAGALWRQQFADRAMGWALRLGMTITIIGAFSGGLMTKPTAEQLESARTSRMTAAGAHTVGAADGGPGLPVTGWSRTHGDLRVAHFIGLHALQILPLVALAIGRFRVRDDQRARLVVVAAASLVSLFFLLIWQALRGQSIVAPDGTTIAALASWAVLTTAAFALATVYREPSRVLSAGALRSGV